MLIHMLVYFSEVITKSKKEEERNALRHWFISFLRLYKKIEFYFVINIKTHLLFNNIN